MSKIIIDETKLAELKREVLSNSNIEDLTKLVVKEWGCEIAGMRSRIGWHNDMSKSLLDLAKKHHPLDMVVCFVIDIFRNTPNDDEKFFAKIALSFVLKPGNVTCDNILFGYYSKEFLPFAYSLIEFIKKNVEVI